MSFEPNIEKRKEYFRNCECGHEHEIKLIRGMFNYSDEEQTIFCAALLEHSNEKHIWLSFLTGEWPDTGQEDCAVTCHIYLSEKGRHFSIVNGEDSPFEADDIFECYQITREQVLAVEGAKDWFIETYLLLFKYENEIGNYLSE